MYPIHKTPNGIGFSTNAGVKYEIYFTELIQASEFIEAVGLETDRFFYFGFHQLNPPVKRKTDPFVMRTIAIVLFQFFFDHPEAILVFNYSDRESRVRARRKMFLDIFSKYSENTRIKLFQHDFSDAASVCALYVRQSHPNFQEVQKAIESLVKNIDVSIKL